MSKYVEMIEEYKRPDYGASDYQWYDNHGILIRCRDCKYYESVQAHCTVRDEKAFLIRNEDDYCSRAVRKEDE